MENAKNENLRTYVPPKIDYLATYVLQYTKKRCVWEFYIFPAPKMFFCQVFKDPIFEGLEPLWAY